MELIEALKILLAENIGDFIYDIRDTVSGEDRDFTGNTWDHPRVVAWGEACQAIKLYVEIFESGNNKEKENSQ